MKIKDIAIKEIFTSRGEATIEVDITNNLDQKFWAQIPSGKSRGKNEAVVKPYLAAKKIISFLKPKIIDIDFQTISEIDDFLIQLDGTSNKEKIGGNLMLGLSIAFCRALAQARGKAPWQILRQEFFSNIKKTLPPLIFSNLINGGSHALNNLRFQEYLVVVLPEKTINQGVVRLKAFYQALGDKLRKVYKINNLPLGDEEGYALNFKNNFEPLQILTEQIKSFNLEKKFLIGLDAAATSFYKNGFYEFENQQLSSEALLKIYIKYFEKMESFYSLEDPFSENDPESFIALRKKIPDKLIIGDDLTVTNPKLIWQYAQRGAINGVIIKPNQIGTILETCRAINTANNLGIKPIISHRSGETEDDFIIHLAKASSAFGVKIGAPAGSRLPKFNSLVTLYNSS